MSKLIFTDTKKYNELLKVSNPDKVIQNAKKYFNDPNIEIYLSPSKNKKYMIFTDNYRKKHFGDIRWADFTITDDMDRRTRYLNRAANIPGNWRDDKYSPNNLSINLLWQ